MAIFVRKHYYNDMHEKCEDDAGFVSWWYGVQGSLQERIKVKRTNIMSAIHKTFKGESKRRGDGECLLYTSDVADEAAIVLYMFINMRT